jgi:hypothetical protein
MYTCKYFPLFPQLYSQLLSMYIDINIGSMVIDIEEMVFLSHFEWILKLFCMQITVYFFLWNDSNLVHNMLVTKWNSLLVQNISAYKTLFD